MPTRTLIDRLLADHARTGALPAISGGDGTDENNGDQNQNDDGQNGTQRVEFSAEQSQEIGRIVAREVKTARDKAIKAEQDRIKAEQDAADAERQRKADEAKGEYEKVKTSLTNDLNTVKGEFEAAKAEYEAVKTYFETQYAAALKDLPEYITDLAPKADASFIERSDWLTKAQAAAKKAGNTQTGRGNGGDPKPGGSGFDLNQEVERNRAKPAFRIA